MLLLIDNYDSFTHNLARYFEELGQEVVVVRNDQITLAQIEAMAPQYLVFSPGPCTPDQAGITLDAIRYFAGKLPLLGVCLGHQAIGQAFGAKVVKAQQVLHGKVSNIVHQGQLTFAQLPSPMRVTRYHSLVLAPESLPDCFQVLAWSQDHNDENAEIMAISHKNLPVFGVQFHPESLLTEYGHALLKNYLLSHQDADNKDSVPKQVKYG